MDSFLVTAFTVSVRRVLLKQRIITEIARAECVSYTLLDTEGFNGCILHLYYQVYKYKNIGRIIFVH